MNYNLQQSSFEDLMPLSLTPRFSEVLERARIQINCFNSFISLPLPVRWGEISPRRIFALWAHEPSQTQNPKGIPPQSPGLRRWQVQLGPSYPGIEASNLHNPFRVAPDSDSFHGHRDNCRVLSVEARKFACNPVSAPIP